MSDYFTRKERDLINKAWAFFWEAAGQIGMQREVEDAAKFERRERKDTALAKWMVMSGAWLHRTKTLADVSYLSQGVRIGAMAGARMIGSTNVEWSELVDKLSSAEAVTDIARRRWQQKQHELRQ